MKRIFLFATAGLLMAACSNNDKEEPATPAKTEMHTEQKVVTIPAPAENNSASTVERGKMTRPSVEARDAKLAPAKSPATTTGNTMMGGTASRTASTPAMTDSNTFIVHKKNEEAFMRKKIRESNSIDGGGQ